MNHPTSTTLGELKKSGWKSRTVKEELRANLISRIRAGSPLFEGIHGYEDTVVPALERAILAGHSINLLLLTTGVGGVPPIVGEAANGEQMADPIPQALILTSIVISLAVSTFLFAMAYRNFRNTQDPEIEDELEPDEFADAEAGAGEE